MPAFQTKRETLLATLAQAAATGASCPSNRELVTWAGHDSDAANILASMVRLGDIRVERRGGNGRRIQICSTGQWTGWSVQRHGDRSRIVGDEVIGPKMSAAEIAARRVEREACPLCQVRSDVGCHHSAAAALPRVSRTLWELGRAAAPGLNYA